MPWRDEWNAFPTEDWDNGDNEFVDRVLVQERRNELPATHHPDVLAWLIAEAFGKSTNRLRDEFDACRHGWRGDFDRRQTFDASGVGFRRHDGGYRVDIVLPDTPASRAGLREGDTLVTIDGRAAHDLTPVQLRDLLSRPGAVCDLQLDRGGAPVHLELRLESRL